MATGNEKRDIVRADAKAGKDGEKEQYNKYFLLLLVVLVTLLFLKITYIFIIPVLLAAVLSSLFYPIYRRVLRIVRNKRTIASLITCILLLLVVLFPLYLVANMVVVQALQLFQSSAVDIPQLTQNFNASIQQYLRSPRLSQWVDIQSINWQSYLQQGLRTGGTFFANIINKTSKGVFNLVLTLLIMMFTLFYFFRDGPQILKWVKYLIPLSEKYEDLIIDRVIVISKATLKGTMVIAIAQASIGGITLWILGVQTWLLWTVVMIILCLIPVVGAWPIMVTAAIIQFLMGHTWQGILILVITFGVISTIDNILRPVLLGKEAKMHDLLVFFSTMGGISVFGMMGFIIGPVIAALFLSILHIYSIEFKPQLDYNTDNIPKDSIVQEEE